MQTIIIKGFLKYEGNKYIIKGGIMNKKLIKFNVYGEGF